MRLFNLAIIIIILIIPSVHAWSWDSYEGKTTWDVVVTVDERGDCGGNLNTHNYKLTIAHNKETAKLSDLGHGEVIGTFTSNILAIAPRTIDDGVGKSTFGAVSVAFTPDCKTFYTKYPWTYYAQYQTCKGSTAWTGKRTDATACPDAFYVPEQLPLPQVMKTVAEIKKLPEAEQKAEYEKALEKNPRDFQANNEIADIFKSEKNYPEFIKHKDKALENKNSAEQLRKARQDEVRNRLGFTIDPTTATVPLLRSVRDQIDTVPNPMIYNFNVLKTPDTRSNWQKFTEYLSDKLREPGKLEY
jgi:hypothetical protein